MLQELEESLTEFLLRFLELLEAVKKGKSAPRSGAQQVAPGQRSAARGLSVFNKASPGRGDRNDCHESLSVALPGLPSLVAPFRGLRASRWPPATCLGPCRGLFSIFSQLLGVFAVKQAVAGGEAEPAAVGTPHGRLSGTTLSTFPTKSFDQKLWTALGWTHRGSSATPLYIR